MINMENIEIEKLAEKEMFNAYGYIEYKPFYDFGFKKGYVLSNKQLLDEIDMLKFQLKAADSVNEGLSEFKEDIIKAMDSELDCVDTCYKIDEIISNLTNQNK